MRPGYVSGGVLIRSQTRFDRGHLHTAVMVRRPTVVRLPKSSDGRPLKVTCRHRKPVVEMFICGNLTIRHHWRRTRYPKYHSRNSKHESIMLQNIMQIIAYRVIHHRRLLPGALGTFVTEVAAAVARTADLG